jgi:hypothetical protein
VGEPPPGFDHLSLLLRCGLLECVLGTECGLLLGRLSSRLGQFWDSALVTLRDIK